MHSTVDQCIAKLFVWPCAVVAVLCLNARLLFAGSSETPATKGTTRLEFAYDYLGRRFEKKVYEDNTLTRHQLFVYDGFKQIAEYDALNSNVLANTYLWQPVGLDVPLLRNGSEFLVSDANKNIVALLDVNGSVTDTYIYAPFGNCTHTGTSSNPFRFSSEYFDAETGLVYYNYRYYSPTLGRWLSRDPLLEANGHDWSWLNFPAVFQASNHYQMVHNNPLYYFDYNGLIEIIITPHRGKDALSHVNLRRNIEFGKGDMSFQTGMIAMEYWGFGVSYRRDTSDCICSDGNNSSERKGTISLGQYKEVNGHWEDDNFYHPNAEKEKYKRLPKYLNLDGELRKTGVRYYPDGNKGSHDGQSYFDLPHIQIFHFPKNPYYIIKPFTRTYKIQAICTCPCQDDYVMQEKVFTWNSNLGFMSSPRVIGSR